MDLNIIHGGVMIASEVEKGDGRIEVMFKRECLHDFIEIVPGDNFQVDHAIVDEFLFEGESGGIGKPVLVWVEGSDVVYDIVGGKRLLGKVT
jgi:hypothetical protein